MLFRMAKGFALEYVRQYEDDIKDMNTSKALARTDEERKEVEMQGASGLYHVKACMKKLADIGVPQDDNFHIVREMIDPSKYYFIIETNSSPDSASILHSDDLKGFMDNLYNNDQSIKR